MEANKMIDKLMGELADLKAQGHESVRVDALEKYLEELRASLGSSIELKKLEHQSSLAYYDARTKHGIEMFKSVIESGREALNALVLINGGAVVALLGFMGAVIAKGLSQTLGASLTYPLLQFGIGVLVGAVAFGARYFSQAFYSAEKNTYGTAFKVLAISLALAGYALFSCGVYGAFHAFTIQFSQ
jgi:hypothetical protein